MSSDSQYVKAPRSIGFDFFLCVITVSLFSCVWLYQAVRDINRIKPQGFTPWLWIFLPLLLIPQFFALPRFLSALNEAETEQNLTPWSKIQDLAWVVGSIGLSIVVLLSDLLTLSLVGDLLLVLTWLSCFLSIGPRVNRLRQASRLPKTKLSFNLSNPEWAFSILMIPVCLLLIWFNGLKLHFDSIEKLTENQRIENIEYGFALTTAGHSWNKVEVGTYSDGEAILELGGHNGQASIVVFVQQNIDIMSNHTQWRIEEATESMSNTRCKEERKFLPNTMFLRVRVQCEGEFFSDPSLHVIELIQTSDQAYIEAYADYSAPEAEFKREKEYFLKTVYSLNAISMED